MRVRRFKFRIDPLEAMRRRMIAETELALLVGLRFPDRMPRIPTVEVGRGVFHPRFAERFWTWALDLDQEAFAVLGRSGRGAVRRFPS